jgi:hypothetical protein
MYEVAMALFKEGAIKRTTKKKTWQIFNALGQYMSDEDLRKSPEDSVKLALLKFIETISLTDRMLGPPYFSFAFPLILTRHPRKKSFCLWLFS